MDEDIWSRKLFDIDGGTCDDFSLTILSSINNLDTMAQCKGYYCKLINP